MIRSTCNKRVLMGSFALLVLLALAGQSSLVNGNSYVEDEEIILRRLDLARLSQIRLETRRMDLDRRCNYFDGELRSMIGGAVSLSSQSELLSRVMRVLGSRRLPFGNNQPVLEDLEICYDAARSGSLRSHLSDPYRREVIASPPYVDPIRDSSDRHMNRALNEFNSVRNRVRDYGQDLYGSNRVVNGAKREIANGLDRIEDKLEDIVEDAADGRLDGIKGGRSYGLMGGIHDASPHAVAHETKRAIKNGLDRIEDRLEDIVEDAADGRLDGMKSGIHGAPYGFNNGHLSDRYAAQDAKNAIRAGLSRLEDKLEDVVEDAADGRLDGIKSGIGHHNYGPGYSSIDGHLASQDAKRAIRNGLDHIEDKLEDIVEDAADGRLDGIKSNMHRYPGHMGYPPHGFHSGVHPAELAHDAKRAINNGLNRLEDKLEDMVEDAADGRLDGIKSNLHRYPGHMGYPSGVHPAELTHDAKRAINNGLNRIEDKLEDLVEDAADGRIDGLKGVHPSIHDPYAYGGLDHHGRPYLPHHSPGYLGDASHDARRAIKHGLNKIEDKIEDIVEDAADGRLDGFKSGIHSSHYLPSHQLGHLGHDAAYTMHSGLNRIEDKLEDLVEDMEDGRIDGIKGRGLEQRHRAEQLALELARERVENRRLNSMLVEKQYEMNSMRDKLNAVSNELYEKDRLLTNGQSVPLSVNRHSFSRDFDDDDDDDDDRIDGYHGLDPVGMLKKLEDKMSSHEDMTTRCQRYGLFFREMPRHKDRVKQIARMPIYGPQIVLSPVELSQMRRFVQVLSRSYKKSSMKISSELNVCISQVQTGFSPRISGYPSSFDSLRSPLEPLTTREYEIGPDGSRITRTSTSRAKQLNLVQPVRPGFSTFHNGMNRARMSMPSMPGLPPLDF